MGHGDVCAAVQSDVNEIVYTRIYYIGVLMF